MKVIHIYKTYFPDTQGGIEEAIRQISRYTTNHGVENTLLTVSTHDPAVIEFPEAKVIRCKTSFDVKSTPMSLSFLYNFKKNIAHADILHFHFPWPFGEINFLLCDPSKPSLVTYHSDIVKQKILKKFYNPFLKMFLRKVDLIIATSEQYLDTSLDLKPFRKKCKIIPLTIDSQRFEESDDALNEIKKEYGEDFFLFVGQLRYYKGLDYLLEAMKSVNRKLVVVGKGSEEKRLRTKAKSLDLNNVVFAGYQDDVYLPSFYKLCKAFVFPSCERSEAFGMSLLEASLFAKPMISTELGTGTSFINKHGETGIVIPPKNIEQLRHALILLSDNDEICKKYGQNARNRFEKVFNSELIGQRYLLAYSEILKRHGK